MPEHNTITDPNIHEPKGVASASAKQIYVADGVGSGDWKDQSGNVHAGAVITADQTITTSGSAAHTLITGWADIHADNITFSGTTDDWTLTKAGTYEIEANISWRGSGVASTDWEFAIAVDGTTQSYRAMRTTSSATAIGSASLAALIPSLTVGQKITLTISNTNNSGINAVIKKANIIIKLVEAD